MESGKSGDICLRACRTDVDCRKDEGYVCDPTWKTCSLPGFSAIQPKVCESKSPARDAAFGPSEAWSTSASPGLYQFGPSSVLAADGGVVTVYATRGKALDGSVLGVARVDGKGQKTLDTPLKSERANHVDPWIARDRQGTLYAAWLGFDTQESRQEIALATSSDGGATWSQPVPVHEPGDCQEGTRDCLDKPMVVVGSGPKGKGEIVYVMYSGGEIGLRVRASKDGGKTFGPTVTALPGIYGNAIATADGRLHVVTLDSGPRGAYGSAEAKVDYTSSVDGGATFTKPVRVSAADEILPFFFSNASVAVDTKRKWHYIAYVRGGSDAKWDIVLATSKDRVKWKRTKLVGDKCAIHMMPHLALDPKTGTLHIAYYDTEGSRRFAHASCAPGGTKCKVHGAINSEPFAALSTVRLSSKWLGEYQSLLVDEKKRMLHAVWSQTIDESGKQITRLFRASAKLKP